MTWYEQNRGHRVYAPAGGSLDRIYRRKGYRVIDDGDVAVTLSTGGGPVEDPEDTAAVDRAIADETPPEARPKRTRRKTKHEHDHDEG